MVEYKIWNSGELRIDILETSVCQSIVVKWKDENGCSHLQRICSERRAWAALRVDNKRRAMKGIGKSSQ